MRDNDNDKVAWVLRKYIKRPDALVKNRQAAGLQGYLAHKKLPPPQDHRRALGIGLLQGPRRRQFLMSEVPL